MKTNKIEYKGYLIDLNYTGYVNYDFWQPEAETFTGHGETVEDCKAQIDELIENE